MIRVASLVMHPIDNKDREEDPVPSNSSKALPGERIQFQMTLHDEEGGLDDAISAKGN